MLSNSFSGKKVKCSRLSPWQEAELMLCERVHFKVHYTIVNDSFQNLWHDTQEWNGTVDFTCVLSLDLWIWMIQWVDHYEGTLPVEMLLINRWYIGTSKREAQYQHCRTDTINTCSWCFIWLDALQCWNSKIMTY